MRPIRSWRLAITASSDTTVSVAVDETVSPPPSSTEIPVGVDDDVDGGTGAVVDVDGAVRAEGGVHLGGHDGVRAEVEVRDQRRRAGAGGTGVDGEEAGRWSRVIRVAAGVGDGLVDGD